MTRLPLAELRLAPRSHASALGWLALLYRKPQAFEQAAERAAEEKWALSLRLYVHALPYALLLIALGRWLLFGGLGLPAEGAAQGLGFHLTMTAIAIAVGIAVGSTVGSTVGILFGIAGGITVGSAFGIAFEIAYGIAFGIAGEIAFGSAFGIAVGIAVGIAFAMSGGIAGGIAVVFAVGIAFGIS